MNLEKPSLSSFETALAHLVGARVAILFLFHALVFAACYAFAYLVRFEFKIPPAYFQTFKSSLPVVVGVQRLIGAAFGREAQLFKQFLSGSQTGKDDTEEEIPIELTNLVPEYRPDEARNFAPSAALNGIPGFAPSAAPAQ